VAVVLLDWSILWGLLVQFEVDLLIAGEHHGSPRRIRMKGATVVEVLQDQDVDPGRKRPATHTVATVIAAACGLFAVGVFFWISNYQSYTADDFGAMNTARGVSLVAYLGASYQVWNARLSALASYLFLSNRQLFALVNTAALLGVVASMFRLGLRRWPRLSLRDMALSITILAVIWFGAPVQEQTLMWRSGAISYLWPLFFGLLFAIPYAAWFERSAESEGKRFMVWRAVGMLVFGIAVGMWHELIALALCWLGLWLLLCALKRHRLGRIPADLWAGALGLMLGLVALATAPGMHVRAGGEPAWAAADRMGVITRFVMQTFGVDWAAGYVWLVLLLALCLGVGGAVLERGRSWKLLAPSTAFFSAAALAVIPLFLVSWEASSRATFFSFALVVIGILALVPLSDKTVIGTLSQGSLVVLTLAVALLLAGDSGFEVRQTLEMEKMVRWVRSAPEQQTPTGDVVLRRVPANTRRFQSFTELSTDPNHWSNRGMAEYYGWSSVRVEEVTATPAP